MQLTLVNKTGATKTYLSGSVSIPGNSSLSVTDTTKQLSLSTDGSLRSDIFADLMHVSDGTTEMGGNDAWDYLKRIPTIIVPISDGNGNAIGSDAGNPGIQYLRVSAVQSIVASTNNSSTANLASGASFTGTSDISLGQSAIEINIIADQPLSIKVQQSSDGTHWDISDTYDSQANQGDARTFQSLALYWRIIVTNTGVATTTYFRLQSALVPMANPVPRTLTDRGNFQVSISETAPWGSSATQLFDDTYDTGLDTTNRWSTPVASGGGVSASTNTPGDTALGSGTTANGYSILTSQATFPQEAPGWLLYMNAVNLESPVLTNAYRFWGFGTTPATPTASAPLTDAIGFEVATTGKMFAVCFSSGTRNVIQDLSVATGNGSQPIDTVPHKYYIFFRGDVAYWALDDLDNIVATMSTGAKGPTVNNLPLKMLCVAGATPPSSNAQLQSNALFVGDTSRSSLQISDGLFPWRKAAVKPASTAAVSADPALVVALSPNTFPSSLGDPTTSAQTANYANSTAPATASLSNTAASYTTLGGQFLFNSIAGAETDYCLFGYQVPSGSTLRITDIMISTRAAGSANASNQMSLEWGIAVNSSGVSLATGSPNPPIRLNLGLQTNEVQGGLAGGSISPGNTLLPCPIIFQPKTPLVCLGGRYVQIILRIPVGTAQTNVAVRGTVTILGYFE